MDQTPKPRSGERPHHLNGAAGSANGKLPLPNAAPAPVQHAKSLVSSDVMALKALAPMSKKNPYIPPAGSSEWNDYASDPGFKNFAREMRDDLAPEGALQRFLADRVILTAWRLKTVQDDLGADPDDSDEELERLESRAERALTKALGLLEKAKTSRQRRWGKAAAAGSKDPAHPASATGHAPAPAGAVKDDRPTASASPAAKPAPPAAAPPAGHPASGTPGIAGQGHERLTLDASVSADSPVVKGTKLTVRHVVSLIVDGLSWEQILKRHPELTEEDIRACLAYAVEEESGGFKAS